MPFKGIEDFIDKTTGAVSRGVLGGCITIVKNL